MSRMAKASRTIRQRTRGLANDRRSKDLEKHDRVQTYGPFAGRFEACREERHSYRLRHGFARPARRRFRD